MNDYIIFSDGTLIHFDNITSINTQFMPQGQSWYAEVLPGNIFITKEDYENLIKAFADWKRARSGAKTRK